ncbi:MAG: 2-phosphosulfolactate phosphatase [Chloroflexi bacterium]|nr:2-phosphosulfolactate phosphatase [Chloroflexota bacterium]
MEIRMGSLLRGAQEAEGTAIIIDVYRAFTTAAVAFSRGVEKIVLVAEVEEALELRNRGMGDLCMGEVAGIRPDGFDFGNSPFELSQAEVSGKTLIQSTRAGTVGVSAAQNAEQIYVGSLVIAEATVKAILRDSPELVSIVAMGSEGIVKTDEDEQCAFYLRNLFQGRKPDHDAVRSLILIGEESQKYGDPARPHFHAKDKELALQIDTIPFAIKVSRENGLMVARPEAM